MPERRLTLVQMNDTHGYISPHLELFRTGRGASYRTAGGFSRIAGLLSRYRQDNPGGVLAFDGGDTIHGTYPAVASRGEALIPILSSFGLSAWTAHWDFAYGPGRLFELAARLPYPLLAVNCYDRETGNLAFEPYRVVEAAGVRVGVLGIAAVIVDKTMPPSFSTGLRFTLGREELPGWIGTLREVEKVDLVVLVSHLGFPQELQLAREVDGIDVLLSSHTHNRLYEPVVANGTIIIQSGCHGSFLGVIELELDGGQVQNYRHRLEAVSDDAPVDPDAEALVRDAELRYRADRDRVVGRVETPLHRYAALEAPMDTFLLQALLDLTGDEVAFSNGWRYGAPVRPGPVTMNDLWNIIPTDPQVSRCTLTGLEIREMMEENLEHTFSRDPYRQMGGYLKRSVGLEMYFKVENEPGTRIQELFIRGAPVNPDREYTVTFVTVQAVPERYGSNRGDTGISAVEALERYLAAHSPVRAGVPGAVVAV